MWRWNGWGDDSQAYPLSAAALSALEEWLGKGRRPADATLDAVLATVPGSRLPAHPLVSPDSLQRLRHARGQSLPDWIALRSGRIGAFPDGVAQPASASDIAGLLAYAAAVNAAVIPFGGGTSVVGHINPQAGEEPTLTINLRRLNRLRHFDEVSGLATIGAGAAGPEVEAQLRARGYTLGHYPQSFEYSTVGGWIATRSSGQQSLRYGRIEDLFAGGQVITPGGTLPLPAFPASAAGPDVRHLILGSEGRLGIITEAVLRVRPLPEHEEFHAVFFPSFEAGQTAVRHIVQERLPLSLLRLSTAEETRTTLALAGHERLIGALESLLAVRGAGEDKAMLLCGFTGANADVRRARRRTFELTSDAGGVQAGRRFGEQWMEGRFRTPYLRNTLWEYGYAVDTLETATTWAAIPQMIEAIEGALRGGLEVIGERVHVFTHLSHVYPQGASIYSTYLFRLAAEPDETMRRWQLLKGAASRAIVDNGGTISHQHGVGVDHKPYLAAEKGEIGLSAIRAVATRLDPEQTMNPGKLLD